MELTTEKRCIDLGYLSIGIGHSPLVKRIEFRQYSTTKDVIAIDCILFHRTDGAIYSIRGAKVQKIGIPAPFFFEKFSFIFKYFITINLLIIKYLNIYSQISVLYIYFCVIRYISLSEYPNLCQKE